MAKQLGLDMKHQLEQMSTSQLEAIIESSLKKKKQMLAKKDYYTYLQMVAKVPGGVFKHGKHIELLCKKLEAVERGEITRLMVSMPPRHAKSTTITNYFPSWFMGRNPTKEVIIGGYGADIAYDFSKNNREALREHGKDIFGVKLSDVRQGIARWEIAETNGAMTAAGVGGPIMGRGASLAVIDDPIKNAEESNSETRKNIIYEWYRSDLRTRMTPDGVIIIVMTRWCEDDLIGKLLEDAKKQDGEKWEYICMPAIIEEEEEKERDIFQREMGEVLWPEHFTNISLQAIKTTTGTYGWKSKYQQTPVPFKEIIFKTDWLKYYKEEDVIFDEKTKRYYFRGEPIIKRLAAIDPATGESIIGDKRSDYTACFVADVTISKNILLRMRSREKILIPEQYKKIVGVNQVFSPDLFLIEEIAFQKAIRQTLTAIGIFIPFRQITRTRKSKQSRIMDMAPFIEWGKLWILEEMEDLVKEYKMFPTGKHDDLLDCLEMLISYVRFEIPMFGNPKTGYYGLDKIEQVDPEEIPNKIVDFIFGGNNEYTEDEKMYVFN
jgi:predicted phage terminase large subunit-like protein